VTSTYSSSSKADKLSERQLDLIVRQMRELPVLPEISRVMLELVVQASSPDGASAGACLQKAIALAGLDVSLSCQLIRQANQADKGLPPVGTAALAVERLGFDALRSAVLLANVADQNSNHCNQAGLLRFDHWRYARHCLAVAIAGRQIAIQANLPVDPAEVFQAGLLHDVGQLAMQAALPKSYARVLSAEAGDVRLIQQKEREIIGVDHCVFGRRLAEYWRLGALISQSAWLCPQGPAGLVPSDDQPILSAICLAEIIADQAGLDFLGQAYTGRPGGIDTDVNQQARQLNLSEKDIESLRQNLPDLLENEISRFAIGQNNSSAKTDCANTAAKASAELARMNQQLQAQAQTLAADASAFGHLREFIANLSPQASVDQMLLKIAQAISSALDIAPQASSPIIVYCVDLGEGVDQSLAICFDGSDNPPYLTLSAPAMDDAMNAPEQMSAQQVADAMSASVLAKWADLRAYLHQPLSCARRWVGGVFYPRYLPGGNACAKEALSALAAAMALALATVQDRSKAVRMSEQLASASQMLTQASQTLSAAKALAAVGEIAGGAAHEINNPLAVISGRAQIMQKKATTPEDRQTWQNVAQQAHRISDIITELMEFASPPAPTFAKVSVSDLFNQAIRAIADPANPRTTQAAWPIVDIEISDDVPPIWADAAQVLAVICELIVNAANARSKRVVLSAKPGRQNDTVLLTASDDGDGMDQATETRAFAPFFSRQQAGRRRGMGLPKAMRYVELNGGRMWLNSRPAAGTVVSILLQIAK
jgi:signal transduction histidine kinase/HD-like signal output (HDOD) protein